MVPMNIVNIYEKYDSYFNADLKAVFELLSKTASKNNFKLFLIGGLVRDMLLATHVNANEIAASGENIKSPPRNDVDIDITVEGDAIEFAQILKKELGAKITSVHKNFGTVKIEIQGKKIDLASTRNESYPRKGHLPGVNEIGCSLEQDILRRDFTVNSLAMSLNEGNFGDLIDYTKGFEDLKNKKIRVLHDNSFIDDPTRIIRALKYASRLGFTLEEKTLKLQQEYLKNINYDMGIKRIKQEIKKTFDTCSDGTFNKFVEEGIYKLITKKEIKKSKNIQNLIKIYSPNHPWLVYFGVIIIDENLEKFSLTKHEKEVIEGAKCLLNTELKDDFSIYKAFFPFTPAKKESLLIAAALGKEKEVCHYLDNLANIKLHIKGDDLIELGYKPSKKFKEAFDYVLKEKLKNRNISQNISKREELKLIKAYLERTFLG